MSHDEPTNKMFERERIVFEIIKNNLELHHNALMKLVVPEFMAKSTFEKTRDLLIEKKIISVKIKGNMKFYVPMENYEQKLYQYIEHSTNSFFHDLKFQIKKLEFDFPRRDIDEKIKTSSLLLRNLLQTDNGFTLLDSIKNPKKTLYRDEHLTIQQLIYKVITVIRNDADFEIIYPTVANYVGIRKSL